MTVWWIDYWNLTGRFNVLWNRFEWPFDGSTTETFLRIMITLMSCSSDRLMDRLLKHSISILPTTVKRSSDRLMDRLLKHLKCLIEVWFDVRVTVWWIDYWNINSEAVESFSFVRVTVWWIDYWNLCLLHSLNQPLGSSDRLMDRLLKPFKTDCQYSTVQVRVTVWWIDYWNCQVFHLAHQS